MSLVSLSHPYIDGGGVATPKIVNENLFINPYWMSKDYIINQRNKSVYDDSNNKMTIDMWHAEHNLIISIDDEEDCICITRRVQASPNSTGFAQLISEKQIIEDAWYTISFLAKGIGNIQVYPSSFKEAIGNGFKPLTDKYNLYSVSCRGLGAKYIESNLYFVALGFLNGAAEVETKMYLKAAKFERGLESTLATYVGEGYGFDGWVINDNPDMPKQLYECQRRLQPVLIYGKDAFYNNYYPDMLANKKILMIKIDLNPPPCLERQSS